MGAPVETLEAISTGLLGPLFMFDVLQAARERHEGGSALRADRRLPEADQLAGRAIAPPSALETAGLEAMTAEVKRNFCRPALAGDIDNEIGELVHGSPPLWFCPKPEDERLRG